MNVLNSLFYLPTLNTSIEFNEKPNIIKFLFKMQVYAWIPLQNIAIEKYNEIYKIIVILVMSTNTEGATPYTWSSKYFQIMLE